MRLLRIIIFLILIFRPALPFHHLLAVQAATFPNGGFESFPAGGLNDWTWSSPGWVWDRVAHSGAHSARASRSEGAATGILWSGSLPAEPSTNYTLSYWLRYQDATALPTVEIHQFKASGAETGLRLLSMIRIGSRYREWYQISYRFQTMPDANYIRISLYLFTATTGTFWFDDFSLTQGLPAAYPFQAGFPVEAATVNFSSPVVADINHDGSREILLGDGLSKVRGWDSTGNVLPNFPISTGDSYIRGQIAVADLDGDQDLEIIAGTRARTGQAAHVWIWHHNGQPLSGWPKTVDYANQCGTDTSEVTSVALADVDRDSGLEILAGTTNGAPTCSSSAPPTPNLYAWNPDGSLVAGSWPTWHSGSAIYGAIAAGDLSGDRTVNVITGRDHHYLHAYTGTGVPLPGWPVQTFLNGNSGDYATDIRISNMNAAPIIADLERDGTGEYISAGNVKYPNNGAIQNSGLLVFEKSGERRQGWQYAATGNGIPTEVAPPLLAPAVADLDRDGLLEIVIATYDGWIRAYRANKGILWEFNYSQGNVIFASEPVIGDVDGDNFPEILFGTYDPFRGENVVGLWGLEADGKLMPGYPLAIGSPGVRAAPTLADLDQDGDLEIAAADLNGILWVWDDPEPYHPYTMFWPTGRHDYQRSGAFTWLTPDLSSSQKVSSRGGPTKDENVTYTIRLANTGAAPFLDKIQIEDSLPDGTSLVPGSIMASTGVYTATNNMLLWSGVMGELRQVNISFQVKITSSKIEKIINSVSIEAAPIGMITKVNMIIANGYNIFLPTITSKK